MPFSAMIHPDTKRKLAAIAGSRDESYGETIDWLVAQDCKRVARSAARAEKRTYADDSRTLVRALEKEQRLKGLK